MPVKLDSENHRYVKTRLRYEKDRLVEEDGSPVMMQWERGIMRETARALEPRNRRILNLGFGMGFIDEAIQRLGPASHHICEPHPDVYARMVEGGWLRRRGVKVHHDFWQRVIDELPRFDAIYFDTWNDSVGQFRGLVNRLPRLLNPNGLFSWFNHPVNPELHDCVSRQGFAISRRRIKVRPPPRAAQGGCYYFNSRVRNYDIVLARCS